MVKAAAEFLRPSGPQGRGGRLCLLGALAFGSALGMNAPLMAQAAPEGGAIIASHVLTLDQERFARASSWGRELHARAEQETAALAAENARIEAELEAEERALTARRPTMTPDAFAPLAQDFDRRVVAIREAQDAKSREITGRLDEGRRKLFAAALPVLGELMSERGATAILSADAVVLSLTAIDITEEVIARIETSEALPELLRAAPPVPDSVAPDGAPQDGPAAEDLPSEDAPRPDTAPATP